MGYNGQYHQLWTQMDCNVLRRIIIRGCNALGIHVIGATALTVVLAMEVQKHCAFLTVIYEVIFDSQKPVEYTFSRYGFNKDQKIYLHF